MTDELNRIIEAKLALDEFSPADCENVAEFRVVVREETRRIRELAVCALRCDARAYLPKAFNVPECQRTRDRAEAQQHLRQATEMVRRYDRWLSQCFEWKIKTPDRLDAPTLIRRAETIFVASRLILLKQRP